MNTKKLIAGILITFGILFIIGSVGSLDYMQEYGQKACGEDVSNMLIKVAVGIALTALGALVCKFSEKKRGKK